MQKIVLGEEDVTICRAFARQACLGGRSSVRGEDRAALLKVDQFIGQLGNAALSVYLTGDTVVYIRTREKANEAPWRGDDGCDLDGLPLDVKTSLMRNSRDPYDYRLIVRPAELHDGHTYVLALVEHPSWEGDTLRHMREATVNLVGWARREGLGSPEVAGMFAGAYVLKATLLNPMMPVEWRAKQLRGAT